MLKINEVYNMDCANGIKLLDDKSIDLVVMDPPYLLNLNKVRKTSIFNNYANDLIELKNGFDLRILDLLLPKMKKINIYIYCSKRQVKDLLDYFISKSCNYEILTWHKQNPSPLINNNYLPDTEYVVFAREKGVKLYGNYFTKHKYFISGVNQIDKRKYGHQTIKNLNFVENHIINSSKEGDVVLDCFCGSGTTLVGAINTNWQFIGFEINKEYYEIAKRRVEEALSKSEETNEPKNTK